MQTILIGTDFSEASRNASIYGMQFAVAINAKVILFNAYQVSGPIPSLLMQQSPYGVMEDVKQRLDDEAAILKKDSNILIETICIEGNAEDEINGLCKEKKIDYIIVGMKGSRLDFKKIFGNTVTALAKSSFIPVLVIPKEAKFSSAETIVFASDISLENELHSLDELIKITQLFKSKLFVVKVIKNDHQYAFEQILAVPGQLKKVLAIADISYQYPVNTDIRHALNQFIKQHNVGMLVMLAHKHDWFELLFKKSETTDMIFHTQLPLLVLPEKKYEETHRTVIVSNIKQPLGKLE